MAAAKKAKPAAKKSAPAPKASAPARKTRPKATDAQAEKDAPRAPKTPRPKAAGSKTAARPGADAQEKKPAAKPKAAAKPKSRSKSSGDTYTDPALRDRLKDEITAGDKGGKPGQWSARKAQLLASEYEKAGGGYKNGAKKKTASQEHLDQWTDEDWKTSDDKPADREGGTTRYLPAEAWDKLTPAQKKATNAKKQAGSAKGEQFVDNTAHAKEARQAATAKKPGPKKPGPKKPGPKKAASKSASGADSATKQGSATRKEPRPRSTPKAEKKATD